MPKRRQIGVTVSELKRHFGKYLLLSRKVDLVIFRRGKPVAVMVGIERFRRLVSAANRGGRNKSPRSEARGGPAAGRTP